MKKPNCILIPVDFSETSAEAMEFGAMIASQMGAEIVLLTVLEPFAQFDVYTVFYSDGKDAAMRLRSLFHQRMADGAKEFSFHEDHLKVVARYGAVIDEIVHAAQEFGADMIIMGTHGRRGISRAFLGSVTEEIIRVATCPVLAIRAGTVHPAALAENSKAKLKTQEVTG